MNEAYDREIESRKESLRQVELIALQEANLQNVCAVAPEVSQVDPLAETASLGLAQATEDRTDSTQPSCLPQTLAADASKSLVYLKIILIKTIKLCAFLFRSFLRRLHG